MGAVDMLTGHFAGQGECGEPADGLSFLYPEHTHTPRPLCWTLVPESRPLPHREMSSWLDLSGGWGGQGKSWCTFAWSLTVPRTQVKSSRFLLSAPLWGKVAPKCLPLTICVPSYKCHSNNSASKSWAISRE